MILIYIFPAQIPAPGSSPALTPSSPIPAGTSLAKKLAISQMEQIDFLFLYADGQNLGKAGTTINWTCQVYILDLCLLYRACSIKARKRSFLHSLCTHPNLLHFSFLPSRMYQTPRVQEIGSGMAKPASVRQLAPPCCCHNSVVVWYVQLETFFIASIQTLPLNSGSTDQPPGLPCCLRAVLGKPSVTVHAISMHLAQISLLTALCVYQIVAALKTKATPQNTKASSHTNKEEQKVCCRVLNAKVQFSGRRHVFICILTSVAYANLGAK